MADNNFRSYRSHDPRARRDGSRSSGTASSDPLAELARLIGQNDPYADTNRSDVYRPNPSSQEADWPAEERYAEPYDRAEDRYATPPPADAPNAPSPYAPEHAASYDDELPVGGQYFSGPAAKFNGFHEEAPVDFPTETAPGPRAREVPAYATVQPDDDSADETPHDGGQYVADDEYAYDDRPEPRRRSGVVVIMAVLGLAVVGSAGAFAYRAMFGGSVLPTLPPIIKASNGPNKIVPSYELQANSSNQVGSANTGAAETVVSREEQPVTMEPPRPLPRVVSTIPIIVGQNSASPGMAAPVATGAVSPVPVVSPAASLPNSPPPASVAAPVQNPPVSAPAVVSSEPKKIHTVTIRSDQSGGLDAAAPAPPPAARGVSRSMSAPARPNTAPGTPPAGSNAPLSIVPGANNAPSRSAPMSAPVAVASAGPVAGTAAAPSGGYAVQVTSQRSEGEAQAAFHALRAKYPGQLGGREPIIRRADLGAKGTYYRALVGPFASIEEAAGLCSGLKAAGGNCIVQRN